MSVFSFQTLTITGNGRCALPTLVSHPSLFASPLAVDASGDIQYVLIGIDLFVVVVVSVTRRAVLEVTAADLGEVVDGGKLEQTADHEAEAHDDKPVEGSRIVHLGKVITCVHTGRRQRQHCRYTCMMSESRASMSCV